MDLHFASYLGTAWEFPDGKVSYAELDRRVTAKIAALVAQGVKPGDSVDVCAVLNSEWIVTWLALVKLGAVGVMRHPKDKGEVKEKDEVKQAGLISMIRTSGTTGEPKWAGHDLSAYLESAAVVNAALGVSEQSRIWLNLPVTHIGGLAWVWRALLARATVVVSDTLPPGTTHLSWVPTQLIRALRDPAQIDALRQVSVIYLGGAPVAESVLQTAWSLGLAVWPTYGMTEMTSSIAIRRVGEPGFRVLPGREVKLDASGGIWVRGKSLFSGYVRGNGLVLPLDSEGFFETRDVGAWAGDFLTILGRCDDLMIRGGENIWPSEIEAALGAVSGVTAAKVWGVADPEWGQVVHARVWVAPEWEGDCAEIQQNLRGFLPGFKIPTFLDIIRDG